MITADKWFDAFTHCGVQPNNGLRWAPLWEEHVQPETFSAGIEDVQDFTAQILHESGRLARLEEDLYYTTSKRLMEVWPSRFRNESDTISCLHNPQNLASHVYGCRPDLGNVFAGDGYNFRGSGLIMCTGRANYELVKQATGIDVVNFPDRMRDPTTALLIAIAWWERRVPDAALNNVVRVTRSVNGGTVGLADRLALTKLVEDIIK